MTNLKVESSSFESQGKIQDVLGFNKEFVIENGSVIPMRQYSGKVARIIVTMNKKKFNVHSSAIAIVEDIEKLNVQGLPSVDELSNDNSAKVKLEEYKTEFGTGFKFNYE